MTQSGNTLTANGNGNYQWKDCNNGLSSIPGATGQSYTPTENGVYAVEISQGQCTVLSDCIQITMVSIIENNLGSHLLAFPNPTSRQLTLSLGKNFDKLEIIITNTLGQIVQRFNSSYISQIPIELAGASGMYWITLRRPTGETATIRVLKK